MARKPQITLSSLDLDRIEALLAAIPASVFPGKADLQAELDRAGINVCFAQDSIQDPWYPVGNGNIMRILDAGLHICHMLGYEDLQRCLDLITDNSARALCLGDNYGIAEGRPANLLILDAENDYDAVCRQAKVLTSVRHGKVIMQRQPEEICYPV